MTFFLGEAQVALGPIKIKACMKKQHLKNQPTGERDRFKGYNYRTYFARMASTTWFGYSMFSRTSMT